MIITKTPFRLSLFGGGTDYPAWFEKHPSRCVSAAMAHYCYLTVKKLPPFFEYRNRIVYSKTEDVNDFADIDHPSVRACLQYLKIPEGISITHDGDLPAKSGIGSSSSFTVGLLHALYTLKSQSIDRDELARQAIHVEQKIIGENVGIQDQIMAAKGGIQLINMSSDGWTSDHLNISNDYKTKLESNILLGFSGVSRHAEEQSKKKVENIKSGKTENLLYDTAKLAEDAIEALAKEKDMSIIGELLDKAWNLKRGLADGVTQRWIDEIYYNAIESGAHGGKLMGAGGGGFFMFLVPTQHQEEFKKRMKEIKVWVPFKFDNEGTQLVLNNTVN